MALEMLNELLEGFAESHAVSAVLPELDGMSPVAPTENAYFDGAGDIPDADIRLDSELLLIDLSNKGCRLREEVQQMIPELARYRSCYPNLRDSQAVQQL
jgi:hypothetical protein